MARYWYAIESRKTDGALALHRFETERELAAFVEDGRHGARSTAWDADDCESTAYEAPYEDARARFPQAFSNCSCGEWYPVWNALYDGSEEHPNYGWVWLEG